MCDKIGTFASLDRALRYLCSQHAPNGKKDEQKSWHKVYDSANALQRIEKMPEPDPNAHSHSSVGGMRSGLDTI